MEFKKVCVIGMGYIGLPTASTFASKKINVIGVDVNHQVIDILKRGDLHIVEPGLRPLVEKAISDGHLSFSLTPCQADAYIIAVPTPFKENKKADMRYVVSAVESILPFVRKGNLVVLESTSPPRTTIDLVTPILERSGLKVGSELLLAYSPERVLPGQILRELIENARVIGGVNNISAEAGRDLYANFVEGEIILTDATTAEMVKLMENTYRDVNIAIANEFSRLADRFGINIWEAINLANRHPRVKILNPGPGVGGHCISVDPWFLVESAPEITPLIHTARQVNDSQPHFVVEWIDRVLGGIRGKKICALGLTYKPDVDDFRESPAIEVVHLLQKGGAEVKTFDPFQMREDIAEIMPKKDISDALGGVEAVVILVAHRELSQLDPRIFSTYPDIKAIFDTTNLTQDPKWSSGAVKVFRLGSNKAE